MLHFRSATEREEKDDKAGDVGSDAELNRAHGLHRAALWSVPTPTPNPGPRPRSSPSPPPGSITATGRPAGSLPGAATSCYLAGLIARHGNRFGALAALPFPDVDDCLAEIERSQDIGLDGFMHLTRNDDRPAGHPD